uniref:Uncharacterized protein n=1 Tax=Setaria digitata TaxID=48799 RepID=A0A915Q5J2_9BILA
MDSCCLSHSSSNSSFETNHSSWSFVGEDDFDLLDDDKDDSASENNEEEEKDEESEKDCGDESEGNVDNANNEINDDGDYVGNDCNDNDEDDGADNDDDNDYDHDHDDNDDDISLVTEEDILNDPNARAYVDVVKVSKQLDKLSKCFDSPFTQVFKSFTSERNVRLMAVISTAAVAVIIFYSAFVKPTMPLTSTESVCLPGEERLLGLQYRDTAPSFLCEFFKTVFKSSIGFWSVLSPTTTMSSTTTNEPDSWIFNSGSIVTSSKENGHFSTNQCEHLPDENQFSAMNEAVQRYLKYTRKTRRYEFPSLPDTNETLGDADNAEPHHDRKLQVDLELIDDSENWNSLKIESSEHSESTRLKISKSRKAVSLPKPPKPIPPFSAKHFSIEPKIDLRTLVSSTELLLNMPLRRELASTTDGKQCSEVLSNIKNVKLIEKEEKKEQYDVDLSSLLADSKLRIYGKVLESGPRRSAQQPKKAKKIMSSVKKAISRTVERAKAHRDKFLEQFRKAIDSIAPKNQRKAFQAEMKAAAAKERCVLNSTCNVLASLARTLAGISLFPAIVGQANAAKYINSLLDLSTCTGLRLVCETCWWTRECCPKERCTFFPWQRHFNTKRFLISQSHVMSEAFAKLGWSMPKRKGRSIHLLSPGDYLD